MSKDKQELTVLKYLVLRQCRNALLQVAIAQRQQRSLVIEEGDSRRQCRYFGLRFGTAGSSIRTKWLEEKNLELLQLPHILVLNRGF